jgi:hypothetical protein
LYKKIQVKESGDDEVIQEKMVMKRFDADSFQPHGDEK